MGALSHRFDFAPVLVNFIMAFPDMDRWFMRYPAPANEYERAINKHTREDETHSRLYLEDWRKLALDQRLGWRDRILAPCWLLTSFGRIIMGHADAPVDQHAAY